LTWIVENRIGFWGSAYDAPTNSLVGRDVLPPAIAVSQDLLPLEIKSGYAPDCIVLYSSNYIAPGFSPLRSRGPTEALWFD